MNTFVPAEAMVLSGNMQMVVLKVAVVVMVMVVVGPHSREQAGRQHLNFAGDSGIHIY